MFEQAELPQARPHVVEYCWQQYSTLASGLAACSGASSAHLRSLPMATTAARAVQRRLGERIQALRHDRELTQDELARRCRISQKYLSELERGEKAPSLDTLVALAHRGFAIRLAALLFGVDEDVPVELKRVDDLLAGRPAVAQKDVLDAVTLLLRAGEASRELP